MGKNVKRVLFVAVLMLVAAWAWAGSQDFTVVNDTHVSIHALYVSPSKADNWGENILGKDTLDHGETLEISFPNSERAKLWDLRIEDHEGNSIEWTSLKLNEIEKVTLHYTKENGKAWADVE